MQGSGGNAGLSATSPPPAWPGFRPLSVAGIDRESDSVISIRLADPDGTPVPAAQPGQYLTLRLQTAAAAGSILRNYSLSGPPAADHHRISVKREPQGAASGYLHTRLRPGDLLDVAAPRGTFILRPADAPVLLISAGVGATPVLAMLHALAAERSPREIWWLHGARSRRDHSFAAESRALLDSLPNARGHVCYSRPGPDDLEGRDFETTGRLSAALIAELDPPRDAEAYLCGPGPFMEEISAALAALGVKASAHPHRALRARALPDARDRPGTRTAAPSTPREPGERAHDRVRPQQPRRPLEPRLHQPARPGRSLRRARPLVLPHRRLPHL